MDIIKIVGIGIIGTILSVTLKQTKPEIALQLSIVTGVILFLMVLSKLNGIIDLVNNLIDKSGINGSYFRLILKITGIAYLVEFAISLCKDAGENAIATKVEFAGKVVILSLSIPIIGAFLDTVTKLI